MTNNIEKNTSSSRLSKFILLMVSLFLVFFILGLLEFNLRAKGFQFDPWRHYARFGQNFEAEDIHYYERDKTLFWKFRPSQVIHSWWVKGAHINQIGLRGTEVGPKSPDKIRILCLGDSGTFGWNVGDNETYPYYLENILNQRKLRAPVEVINGGVPGYTSYQGVEMLRRYAPVLKPELIIFCYGVNDHNPTVYVSDKHRLNPPQWILDIQNQLFRLRTYQLIYREMTLASYKRNKNKFLGGDATVVRVPLEDYRENLQTVIRYCQQQKIKLVFVPRSEESSYRDAMKSISIQEKIPFINLTPNYLFPSIQEFLSGAHPAPSGYYHLSSILAVELDTLL